MATVADCLRQHAPAYLEQFGDAVPLGHRKVISAITRCRTGELGGVVYQCQGCGHEHWVGRSCGNRHCPTCQIDKTAVWLEKQRSRLLPVHHFLVTFTVPQELRMVVRANQKACYDAIFAAGSDTIRTLAADPKWLGTSKVGFFGVLHTWGRDPTIYHPHVHFVVPGGGVSEDGTRWLSTPENFLFPEACASPVYRQKFRELLRAAGLEESVETSVWNQWWEVDVKPVGDGGAVLKYLAPYVYRVAISDKRIVACDETSVTFSYTPTKSKVSTARTVVGTEFVRGFVQHVLPRGFQKIRYYGWMSPNSRLDFDAVKWLVWLFLGWTYWLASGHAPQPMPTAVQPIRCTECGGSMRIIAVVQVNCRVLVEHSLAYFDSG
jgi:hypothetical protein